MKMNVLHVQFKVLFHFEMNRCFCVDQFKGLAHATSFSHRTEGVCKGPPRIIKSNALRKRVFWNRLHRKMSRRV